MLCYMYHLFDLDWNIEGCIDCSHGGIKSAFLVAACNLCFFNSLLKLVQLKVLACNGVFFLLSSEPFPFSLLGPCIYIMYNIR